ncbi:aminomethyltransferase [Dyadobacter sp. BE34]|uniref:Aminomethyltransferase n=1 Tax=Dyadobacter fermentans TaxID=94254 RepID=A0ABU1QR70_9BACT|nr:MULTISPECIES: glycine cleavage system aminomethyltransferase GcvT [Dyadobacter]MDR6803522.1 aminomethyltransferase [Dyadobacter fermentans]MDR7041263.1 aminomethyltransferase [Dyadobacter sp. BE242]MDR7195666.1 aminomethyltransferase [Dyadobacter sp. BE34]MDR7213789.1 aminomethyltransferase [Dyadobacter sp. BE31]MDR7261073.1 aminomethyltransferase [Dyadobacter sp. BE32]
MKTVPLHQLHIRLGAKMVPFAGFEMPVRYSSDLDEHHTVRNAVGVFDVSHMGEFSVKGPGALALIQKVSANDATALYDGKVQYSYLPNATGGVVDDLLVYRIAEDDYFLVVNASNIEKDWNWIQSQNTEGVAMENLSDSLCLLAVQGPNATAALQKLTAVDLASMEYYTFKIGEMAGIKDIIISATGYTGAGGFEIYVKNEDAEKMWDAIFEAGAEFGIKPVGLGARDTLRLEKAFCLYGNDIDDETSPLEAGLGWVTKFTKDFINSETLKAQKEAGLKRKLIGFEMIDRGIPRGHYELCDAEGNKLGEVTSGTQSPTLQKGIGLGYVPTEFSKAGTEIFVKVRDRLLKAQVVKTPFVKN